jgi:very-short-patch-repair endonuclease
MRAANSVCSLSPLRGERVASAGRREPGEGQTYARGKVRLERRLRRQATNAETKLWFALRDRRLGGFKFVRQEAIGSYVVDFVCRTKRLVIEVDGGQHADNRKDRARDAALNAEGYDVLRFWNSDRLTNEEGVLTVILAKLQGIAR